MNNKKIPTSAGTIVLIIIALTVFGAVRKWEKMQESRETKIPKVSVGQKVVGNNQKQNNEIDVSNGSNWKTYRDNNFGYEIKYPIGYIVHKYTTSCTESRRDDVNGENVIIWNEEFLASHDISKEQITDFDIYINDPDDKCVSGHYSSPGRSKTYKLLNSENIIIQGQKVLKRNYIDIPPTFLQKAFRFSTWRFEKNRTYFTLLYNNGASVDPENQKDLFESFLNTFRFLNN
jgi:hypothetical protein